jgi:hypothetical protein
MHYGEKWHYKGANRAYSTFRTKGLKSGLVLYTPYVLRGMIKDPGVSGATPILKNSDCRSGIKVWMCGRFPDNPY